MAKATSTALPASFSLYYTHDRATKEHSSTAHNATGVSPFSSPSCLSSVPAQDLCTAPRSSMAGYSGPFGAWSRDHLRSGPHSPHYHAAPLDFIFCLAEEKTSSESSHSSRSEQGSGRYVARASPVRPLNRGPRVEGNSTQQPLPSQAP